MKEKKEKLSKKIKSFMNTHTSTQIIKDIPNTFKPYNLCLITYILIPPIYPYTLYLYTFFLNGNN